MSASIDKVKADIGFFTKEDGVKEYTEKALANPNLSSKEKIKIVHLNQDNRLSIIKRVQKHTFEHVFIKNPSDFFTTQYHYDWWIFPMHVPKEWRWQQRNYDASINLIEAQSLIDDEEFITTYLLSIEMYLSALKELGWNDYPVRYARMLQSIALFLQASRKTDKMEFWINLKVLADNAINYASQFVIPNYKEYALLVEGFKATGTQVEKGLSHFSEDKLLTPF